MAESADSKEVRSEQGYEMRSKFFKKNITGKLNRGNNLPELLRGVGFSISRSGTHQ